MKAGTVHMEAMSQDQSFQYSDEVKHGPAIIEEERHLGVWATAKLHWRALLICR
jgi:hypothetical protein